MLIYVFIMDSSVYSIIVAAGLDSIVFSGLFCAFLVYRKIRSPVINIESEIEIKRPFLHEGEYEFLDLAKKIRDISIGEVHNAIGEWGFVYLTLHKYIIYTLGVLFVLGCGILLVVYTQGNSEVDDSFHQAGIAHVLDNSSYLVAPIIFLFIFTFLLYSFAYYYYIATTTSESNVINPPHQYAVLITKIPRNFPPEFLNNRIYTMLKHKFNSGIISVYTIPYYEPAYKTFMKYEEDKQKLNFYKKEFELKGVRTQVLNKKLQKVDGIDYYEEKLKKLKEIMIRDRDFGIHTNSGRAYVLCERRKLVREIIEFRVERDDILLT